MNSKKKLNEIEAKPLNPNSRFKSNGNEVNFSIQDFWIWNQSDLIENRNRGILAEFIVKQALNINDATRYEWDSYDLQTNDGIKIEIKSAAYIQAWDQNDYSVIEFGIAPTKTLLKDNSYSKLRKRHADIYIFCLLLEKDQRVIDPMNLNQWKFYILPTKIINAELGDQKKMRISTLKKLNPLECDYKGLAGCYQTSRTWANTELR